MFDKTQKDVVFWNMKHAKTPMHGLGSFDGMLEIRRQAPFDMRGCFQEYLDQLPFLREVLSYGSYRMAELKEEYR